MSEAAYLYKKPNSHVTESEIITLLILGVLLPAKIWEREYQKQDMICPKQQALLLCAKLEQTEALKSCKHFL